ncbi:hypothetical protein, partial [Burkholderia cepacia]|uniref:hypothetical protein n=1 Tax=Burkholderia cepacia TaxID=292 RepID=UPI001E55805B
LEFDSSMPPFLDFTKRWLPFFSTGLKQLAGEVNSPSRAFLNWPLNTIARNHLNAQNQPLTA